ncbi:MAG TPA: Ig-like domain-containing protein, partial [Cyclobacteriaceae bacterium]|nr:Ig-like domain-containing protein [Cyclobacteriaceae bacterium]
LLSAPSIDEPIRAGQTTVSGGAEAGVYINLRIFSRTGGTDAAPVWSSSPRETHTVFVPAGTWQVDLDGPLQAYDRIVARAQKSPDGNECGLGAGNEASSTSITVVEPNEIPEAFDQFVEVEIDNFVEIDLIATDADGDPLSFIISSCPANGVLRDAITNLVIDCSAPFSLSSNRVRYTPNASYLGPDSFTFMANDGAANSNLATISIDVIPINNPPIADDQSVETDEDIQVDITLTGTDPDGDALSFIIVAQPSHGTLSGAGANQTYTPNPGYSGNDSFTFKVNDGRIDSEIATVSITVNPVNKPPVAVPLASDQCIEVMEDTPGAIVLQASDPDGDALTYIIVTPPSHGTLSGTAPNLTYTPEANYFGPDEFTFKVNDGEFDSNVASVCIEVIGVNDPPFITGSVSIVNYVFGNGGVLLDNTLQVNDPDDATIEGVEVSISSNFKVGDELLLTTEPGITASYNAATGELSLLGTASLAAYSATISSII